MKANRIMRRRLNVLHITSWYPTEKRPFSGTFIRDHVRAAAPYVNAAVLHLAGSDPHTTSLWQGHYDQDGIIDGVPTYRVSYKPQFIPTVSALAYFWGAFRLWQQIRRQEFDPDLIHAHSYKGGAVAAVLSKWTAKPLVVSEHSAGFVQKTLAGKKLWQARLAFNTADLILPVSTALQKGIAHYISGGEYRVLPNVVGKEFFLKEEEWSPSEHPPVINMLFVGQLRQDHIKGLPYLFQALALLAKRQDDQELNDGWHLNVVGDGPARIEYERTVAELALQQKITFWGRLPREKVANLMFRSHFLVAPSLHETFSVVAAEGLAAGLPVLATRCGGPQDFINGNVGLLVDPGNVSALYDGVCYMLRNWQSFSQVANSRYARDKFSLEKIGAQLHQIYDEVVAIRR